MIPDESRHRAIFDLVRSMRDIEQCAVQQYRPVVDDILRTNSRDIQRIEHTLDDLLGFCGHEPVVLMFRELCRHYWQFDQAATAYHIKSYREQWVDSDSVPVRSSDNQHGRW